jgi:NADPH2:quinone reductase
VDAVGSGVDDLRVGQAAAFCMHRGSYAERILVPASKVVPLPEGFDADRAAASLLQGMTAHYLIHSTFPLQSGQTAVVHAAAGGVGGLLVQMAKLRGARVVATVSTPEKAVIAREAGADYVVLYEQKNLVDTVQRVTKQVGADVVYDSVGKATFDDSLQCLRPRGLLALFGQSSGAVPPLDPQVLNARGSVFLTRPSLAHYLLDRSELLWRSRDVFDWIRDGKLLLRLDRRFPLEEAGEAHRRLESRRSTGKILLVL